MSKIETNSVLLSIKEEFGIGHELQILEIKSPNSSVSALRDLESGEIFLFQHSNIDPSLGFILLSLRPLQNLQLEEFYEDVTCENNITAEFGNGFATIKNGLIALRIPFGEWTKGGGDEVIAGPVEAFKIEDDIWRGNTFLDIRAKVKIRRGWFAEQGPLRVVGCYRVELENGGFYESRITFDAGQKLVKISEKWSAGAGDQIVWDFSGDDFPHEIFLLDSTAGYTTRKIQPHFDQRHARLWCWTQQCQLHDLRDGYALKFGSEPNSPIAGFVTLDGGSWRGNRLNHMEAWTRRWWREDPFSRRGQGWESKADSLPSGDAIEFRGESKGQAHFNIEGWLAETGERSFALVLTRQNEICPPHLLSAGDEKGCSIALGHFENRPQRAQYVQEQSWLRRIHIQRGLFPLHEVLAIDVSAHSGKVSFQSKRIGYKSAIVEENLRHTHVFDLDSRKEWLHNYLAARVFGFWEAGGLAFTNPVSSRSIAPALLLFEYLAANELLTLEEEATYRAQLLFLATLFYSDNCYPGDSTMQPIGANNSVEPTLAGMANQNFFTDIFNTYGLAAQVFPEHPNATLWREAFGRHWQRQLEYHVYPESGVWEESHTYYQHVLHTILPTCLRRLDDGVADDFANPRFQKMVQGALLQITPRDYFSDGARHLVAFGDHHADVPSYFYLFRELAHAFIHQNKELSAQLGWLYREMNGSEPLLVEPQAIKWESGTVEGLGYFFRTTSENGDQNLLALRSGGAWGHHHHDEASIQFFSGGRALIVDAAFGYTQTKSHRKFMASGHSCWSLENEEPFNFFWRFNRGEIIDSEANSPFPFALANDPISMTARAVATPHPLVEPILHSRRVVQLAPNAFLIIDESDTDLPQCIRFHLADTTFETRDGVLQADYPATKYNEAIRLYIVSMNGIDPELGETDLPEKAGLEQFRTREVCFKTYLSTAFVICAQPSNAPFTVNGSTISGENWNVDLEVPSVNTGWKLTNNLTSDSRAW